MKQAVRKPLIIGLGVLCLLLAAVGSVVPIMQGWIFFVIGVALLASESEIVRGWIRAARRKWPGLSHKINKAAEHRHAPKTVKKVVHQTDPHRDPN